MSEFKIDTDILSMCNNGIKKNSELFSSEFASFSYGKIAQYSLLADMLASIKKQAKQIESDFNTITSKCSNFIDNIIEVENKMSNDEIEHKKIVFNSISISWRNTTPTPSAITSQIDIMSKYYEQHPSSNTQNTASQNTVSATKPVEANNQQTSQNFDLGSSIANNFMGTIDMYKGWFKTGVNKISNDVKNATADAIMTVEDYWVSGAETLLDKWTSGANTINNFIDEKWNTGYNCMKSSGGFVSATADVFKAINDVTIGVRDATKDTIVEVNDAMINLSKNDIDYLSKVRNNELSIGDYFSIKAQESAATYTQMGLSLLGGLSKGGEALLDTATTAITGIVSLPTFVYDLCTGSSVTYSLYQAKDKFVEKDYVGDSQKLLYNNDFGKWVNNHSAFDSDGNVSNFLSSVGEMVTVLATGSVMGGSEAATKATVALSGLKGFGRAEETALQDGASSVEAAAYGLASGVWDAVQMGVGMKINSWVSSNLTTASAMQNVAKASNLKVTTFATSVWLDGIDAGIEGYVQPALQMIYKDRKEGESFKEFYNRLYNEMGGKDYVGRQFLLGALMSAASTGKDLATNKYGKDFQNMTERYQELENIRNTDEYKAYMDDVKNGKVVNPNNNFKDIENEYAYLEKQLNKINDVALKEENKSIDKAISDDTNNRLDAQKLEASGSKVVENDILNSKQNFETKIDDLVAETIQINSEIKTVDAINNYVEQYKKNIELKNKLNELSDSDLELYNIKLLNELLKNNSQKISDNLEFYYSDYTALQFFNQAVNSLDDKNELINAFKKITDGSDVSIISSWRDTEFIDNYNGLFFKISESDIINQNYDSVYKMIGELLASRADDALLNNYQQKLDNINIDDNRYNKMVNDIMNERLSINKNILESLPDADIVNESQVIKEFYDNNQKLNGCCEFISTVNSLSFGDDILYGLNSPSSIIYSNKSLRDSLAIFTKYKLENNEVALSQIKDIFGDEFYKSYENLYEDNMSKIKNMTVKEIPKNEILAQNMDLFESAEDMFESIKNKFEAWGKEDLYLNSLSESEREAYFNSQIKPENKEYIDRLEKAFMHNDDPNLNSDSLSFNLFKRAMNDLLENNPEYGKLFIDAFIFTQKECNISFIADFGQTANYDSSLHTINFDEMIIKNNDYGVAYHEATHLLDGEFKEDHVSEFRPERSATFLHDVRSSIDETNLKKILDEREKLSSMLEDYAREKVDMISIKRQFIESREKVLDDFINKYKLGDKSFENSELSNEELQKFDNLLDGLHFKKRFTENNLPKNMETLKSLEEIYESYTDAVLTKAIEQKYDNMVYQFYDKMVREVANYDELLTSLYGGRDNFFNKFNGNLYGHSDDYYVPTASFGYTKITDEGLAEFSRLTLTKNETGLKQLKAVLGEDLYNYYDEYFNNLMDHIRKTIYNNEN